jgi:hypothetical protein
MKKKKKVEFNEMVTKVIKKVQKVAVKNYFPQSLNDKVWEKEKK